MRCTCMYMYILSQCRMAHSIGKTLLYTSPDNYCSDLSSPTTHCISFAATGDGF